MHRSVVGFRALAGVALGALVLGGASSSLAASKKKHKKHHKAPATTNYVLKGLGTTVAPGALGDITLPNPIQPAQILQRFGRPGPASTDATNITKLNGAIIAVHYPASTLAGVTFNWTPGGSLNLIVIRSTAYRTAQGGVHVGSSLGEVKSAFPTAQCSPYECDARATAADGTVGVVSFDILNGTVDQMNVSENHTS